MKHGIPSIFCGDARTVSRSWRRKLAIMLPSSDREDHVLGDMIDVIERTELKIVTMSGTKSWTGTAIQMWAAFDGLRDVARACLKVDGDLAEEHRALWYTMMKTFVVARRLEFWMSLAIFCSDVRFPRGVLQQREHKQLSIVLLDSVLHWWDEFAALDHRFVISTGSPATWPDSGIAFRELCHGIGIAEPDIWATSALPMAEAGRQARRWLASA